MNYGVLVRVFYAVGEVTLLQRSAEDEDAREQAYAVSSRLPNNLGGAGLLMASVPDVEEDEEQGRLKDRRAFLL